NRGLADCSRRRLCRPGSCNNQHDTNRCTIPRRCQPCHEDRNHSAETISLAQCRRIHLRLHLSPEIFPATYSPSISRRDEIHRPTRMFFLTTRRAPQTRTPLQSANVYPPISLQLPHPS